MYITLTINCTVRRQIAMNTNEKGRKDPGPHNPVKLQNKWQDGKTNCLQDETGGRHRSTL